MIRRAYCGNAAQQLHYRVADPVRDANARDLYCFHPAPFSGVAFTGIMPHLCQRRRVIAPDYPGYGGSDPTTNVLTIGSIARSMLTVLHQESGDEPVDILGFHTGCLVAAELALLVPERIGQLVLVDVPAFDAQTRAKYLPIMGKPFQITPNLECLAAPWDMGMTKRIESQGLERSFEMFVEQLRPGPGMNAAFSAAFSYDVEEKLPQVTQPTLILASQSGLLEASRRAAILIRHADLVERLDIVRAVLDESAERTAEEALAYLDR